MFTLRNYQERTLDSLRLYLSFAREDNANDAFYRATRRPYREVPGHEGLPYVCIRVPTGGGKTLLASHTVTLVPRAYLDTERAIVLWLAPSRTIVQQTREALQTPGHPYRQAIELNSESPIEVLSFDEALYLSRRQILDSTCILVTTLQALRIEDTDGRKVYMSNGALQAHFDNVPSEIDCQLLKDDNGRTLYSLANVLRLYRPLIIVDEAHNARTSLSFETLSRFAPSCLVEYTATPETVDRPKEGRIASNVLAHVSAQELKQADMVKLPIRLRTRTNWKEALGDSIRAQMELEERAKHEFRTTGESMRPIVLVQAQSKGQRHITVDAVRECLIHEFHIPPGQVAISTGSQNQIAGVDLTDPECPVRYVITVRALAEGWDCPWAYVLCSVSNVSTPQAVEQILGRILRMPGATRKHDDALNCAYAFVASDNFFRTATTLRDALVQGSGFERLESEDLVQWAHGADLFGNEGSTGSSVSIDLVGQFAASALDDALAEMVSYDADVNRLTVSRNISPIQMQTLRPLFSEKVDFERLAGTDSVPSVTGRPMNRDASDDAIQIPLLCVEIGDQCEAFEKSHFIDRAWDPNEFGAELTKEEYIPDLPEAKAGEIDVSEEGRVTTNFAGTVHEQLTILLDGNVEWYRDQLAIWIDRKIPHPDIPQELSALFIKNVVDYLVDRRGIPVNHLVYDRHRLARALDTKIDSYRQKNHCDAFQQFLNGMADPRLTTRSDVNITLSSGLYDPNYCYQGPHTFSKHLHPDIGELNDSGEEHECAAFIDQLPEVAVWVRNLERRPHTSFWLQTSTDRFYPDFVAKLHDGRILVVEYKGQDRWSNADSEEKRKIGELWAARSGGSCIFVMPFGPQFEEIRAAIQTS